MNPNIKKVLKLVEPVKKLAVRYKFWLIFIITIGLIGFVFYRINYFNSIIPSEEAVTEKIKTLQRPRIDKTIIEKLENLEHDNIQVQSLFNQARENPFAE